jgi:hypothetical protein
LLAYKKNQVGFFSDIALKIFPLYCNNERIKEKQQADMPGKKVRGESYLRSGEPTKTRCNLSLSKLVLKKLDKLAQQAGLSRSEFIERWIRSLPEPDDESG